MMYLYMIEWPIFKKLQVDNAIFESEAVKH